MSLLLSKSKYLTGLQCPKYLWILSNHPERIPEPDATTQYIFEQGRMIGELARKLFPGGIDLPTEDFMGNIAVTKELLHERRPLFEAGVLSDRLYSRVDVLKPTGEDEWDIIEVKSSTSVKEVNLHDVSFQRLCCEDSGLKIRKCFLVYINNQYVKNGEINPKELFTVHDITEDVAAADDGIRDRIAQMLDIISTQKCPEVEIGPHCSNPYECSLAECWEGLPEHNVFTLYYGGKKSYELYHSGILDITHIPAGYELNGKQRIQCTCVVSGTPYVDKDEVKQFLAELEYPLYYLDFETFGTAIPLFDGIRPYQNIPFQFSLHVVRNEFSQPEHFSYLASGADEPRPVFLKEIKKVIGDTGSIIVYNQGFEEGILKELAQAFPEYDDWVTQVRSRLVDLLIPFRNFHYYHPLQKGSASLKAVLPAITGRGYEGLDISNGQVASISFLSATFGGIPEAERAKVMAGLERYCGRDTEGMIWIVERLKELCD